MHEVYRGKAQTEGFLDDHALLGGGFLSLFDATREPVWRERAITLADAIVRRFVKADGTVSTTTYEKELLLAPQDFGDNAYPSATSATIALLARLGAITGTEEYADFLIPTSVSFEGLAPAQIVYPKPIRFKSSFTPDALNVYEGTAKIVAMFPARTLKARKELRGTLTAQACNNEVCLPPSKLPISAKAP